MGYTQQSARCPSLLSHLYVDSSLRWENVRVQTRAPPPIRWHLTTPETHTSELCLLPFPSGALSKFFTVSPFSSLWLVTIVPEADSHLDRPSTCCFPREIWNLSTPCHEFFRGFVTLPLGSDNRKEYLTYAQHRVTAPAWEDHAHWDIRNINLDLLISSWGGMTHLEFIFRKLGV